MNVVSIPGISMKVTEQEFTQRMEFSTAPEADAGWFWEVAVS